MNTSLLFRKRSPLTDDDLPFITGNETHGEIAVRNETGQASVSAIMVRALKCAASGDITNGGIESDKAIATLSHSKSTPGATPGAKFDLTTGTVFIPNGEAEKITYYFGLPFILEALTSNSASIDFLKAYYDLVRHVAAFGFSASVKPALMRAADELYFWVRYKDQPVDPANDRLQAMTIGNSNTDMEGIRRFVTKYPVPISALSNPEDLKDLIERVTGEPLVTPEDPLPVTSISGSLFVGPQMEMLMDAALAEETILLTGPTGSGKTLCVLEFLRLKHPEALFVSMEGKEGMLDVDFLGAYLPQEDNSRKWQDGPLLYAMRAANYIGGVVLFIDEMNRFQSEQQNIFIGLLNRKPGMILSQMGITESVRPDLDYYYVQVPMTSEHVFCPCSALTIIAACNLGAGYTVHRFDHALRRRFDTVIDFEYLPITEEKGMLVTLGLSAKQAEMMAKLAARTREMSSNGELPGCINTAQLLNWGKKIKRQSIGHDLDAIMTQAKLCWADQVCGRDLAGRVNKGAFEGLIDQVKALKLI